MSAILKEAKNSASVSDLIDFLIDNKKHRMIEIHVINKTNAEEHGALIQQGKLTYADRNWWEVYDKPVGRVAPYYYDAIDCLVLSLYI